MFSVSAAGHVLYCDIEQMLDRSVLSGFKRLAHIKQTQDVPLFLSQLCFLVSFVQTQTLCLCSCPRRSQSQCLPADIQTYGHRWVFTYECWLLLLVLQNKHWLGKITWEASASVRLSLNPALFTTQTGLDVQRYDGPWTHRPWYWPPTTDPTLCVAALDNDGNAGVCSHRKEDENL